MARNGTQNVADAFYYLSAINLPTEQKPLVRRSSRQSKASSRPDSAQQVIADAAVEADEDALLAVEAQCRQHVS